MSTLPSTWLQIFNEFNPLMPRIRFQWAQFPLKIKFLLKKIKLMLDFFHIKYYFRTQLKIQALQG